MISKVDSTILTFTKGATPAPPSEDRRSFRRGLLAINGIALCAAMALLLRATPPGWWMAEMFLSAPVIFLARVREPRMVRAMPLLGVAIAVAYQFFYPSWQTALIGLAYGLGASSIVVAVLRIAEPEEGGLAAARTALVVAMFPAKFYCGFLLLTAAAAKTPQTFDTILTSADKSLGGSLSFAIGRFASASPAAHFILVLAYNSLPTAVMFVAFLRWRRFGPDDEINIPLMVIIAAVSGVALYSLAPAAGPAYHWGTRSPFHPPSTAELVSTVSPVPWRISKCDAVAPLRRRGVHCLGNPRLRSVATFFRNGVSCADVCRNPGDRRTLSHRSHRRGSILAQHHQQQFSDGLAGRATWRWAAP